jgi:hypothetical protein
MTVLRFDYQRQAALDAIEKAHGGFILNVGCNNDPGHIKDLNVERVLNCDIFDTDSVLGHANRVDRLFDCAADTWPFERGEAAVVIFGDILEHLSPAEIIHALTEARRVSERLCITVPEDDRETTTPEEADKYARGAVHRTIVTGALLRGLLEQTGWEVTDWHHVLYGQGLGWSKTVYGYFVMAR